MTGKKKTKTPNAAAPTAAENTSLPPALVSEIVRFMEYTQPRRLNRNLRGLLLSLLIAQKDGFCFDLNDLLEDLAFLFTLLDTMEDTAV